MKILFTADLHSNEEAFRQFVRILDTDDYDCGVIAGDLTEDNVTKEEAIELLGITEDDLLPELSFVEETCVEAMERQLRDMYKRNSYYMQVLRIKEQQLKEILTGTKKPIFIVKGNHDKTEWESFKNVRNIHWKKARFKGYNFIGYCRTEFDRNRDQQECDLAIVQKYMDGKTIFVSHIPAHGVLDAADNGCSRGSTAIAKVLENKEPLLHLHGHVHVKFGFEKATVNGAYKHRKAFASIDTESKDIVELDNLYDSKYFERAICA